MLTNRQNHWESHHVMEVTIFSRSYQDHITQNLSTRIITKKCMAVRLEEENGKDITRKRMTNLL